MCFVHTAIMSSGEAVEILSQDVCRGFGPTLASEYLAKKHELQIGREALRQIMMAARLWRGRPAQRRPGASMARAPELPRGTGAMGHLEHDWLEGRGEKFYLIHMIDDATSELTARFVRHDSTEENIPGAQRPAGGFLCGQGEPVPDRAQGRERRQSGAGPPGPASNPLHEQAGPTVSSSARFGSHRPPIWG